MRTFFNETKNNLRKKLGQWSLGDTKYTNLGNGSFHVTYTHSATENMKHGTNTNDR